MATIPEFRRPTVPLHGHKEHTGAAPPSRVGLRRLPTGNIATWITKSGIAIADQGMISGSNFLVNILLARWLTPDQYGAYAIAFGVFILLSLILISLILEPMAVFGGSSYHDCLREYLRPLLRIQAAISLAIILMLGASAVVTWWVARSSGLPGALAGLTLAAPCLFFMWLFRRSFYIQLSPFNAVKGSALYCCLVVSGLEVLYHFGLLSPFTAFLLMSVGALISSFVLIRQ